MENNNNFNFIRGYFKTPLLLVFSKPTIIHLARILNEILLICPQTIFQFSCVTTWYNIKRIPSYIICVYRLNLFAHNNIKDEDAKISFYTISLTAIINHPVLDFDI